MSLEGQTVLITGGSRGIGRAIALRLAKERPREIIVGYCMNIEAARQTVADIKAAGVVAWAISTDVAKENLLRQMFGEVKSRSGRLDIFICNAARTAFRSALELNARNWQKIMDINARAFLLGSQMAAEIMRQGGGGRIVALSSLGSRYYLPHYAGLGAAKAAMENLARYLAVELAAWNINVNVVGGGFVDTDSMRLLPGYKTITEYVTSRTPSGRLGKPEDLAGVVAFLCSPESDWVRGQTIIADGGYSLGL
jgi:enoyl-[acyl-carrier protein] reductase III